MVFLMFCMGMVETQAQVFEVDSLSNGITDSRKDGRATENVIVADGFWKNWFVQMGLDMTLQNPYGYDFSKVFPNGKSFGLDLAVGKWFSHQVGFRGKFNWENKLPLLENKHANWLAPFDQPGVNREKGGYIALYGDVLFNLHLYLHASMVVGIEDPSYHYRHTVDSGSFKHTLKSINSVIEVARRIESLMKETGNYEKYEDDILFRKFSMKCALVTDFSNNDYNKAWLELFPETHKYIWSYRQFNWKRRMELWLASHNLFKLAVLFQKLLSWQHSLRNLFKF